MGKHGGGELCLELPSPKFLSSAQFEVKNEHELCQIKMFIFPQKKPYYIEHKSNFHLTLNFRYSRRCQTGYS